MKQFEEYREEVAEYMSGVVNILKKRGNYDPKAWFMPLQILAQNLDMWYQCKEQIARDGIVTQNSRGLTTSPAAALLNSTQIRIENSLKEFGLTPRALKAITVEEEDVDDFLDELTA